MLRCITRAIIGATLVVVGVGACTLFADDSESWEAAQPSAETQKFVEDVGTADIPGINEEELISDWSVAEPLNSGLGKDQPANDDWANFEAAEPLSAPEEVELAEFEAAEPLNAPAETQLAEFEAAESLNAPAEAELVEATQPLEPVVTETDGWIGIEETELAEEQVSTGAAEASAEATPAPAEEKSEEVAWLFGWGDDEEESTQHVADREEPADYVNGDDEQEGWFGLGEEQQTGQVPEDLVPEDESFADQELIEELKDDWNVAEPQVYQAKKPVKKLADDPDLPSDEAYAQGDGEQMMRRPASGEPLPTREEIIERLEEIRKQKSPPILDVNGDYRLRVGDTVRISIYGEGNTERTLTIDAHGEISYLLIGRVQAAGFTVDELRRILNEEMRNHLRFALVNVVPVAYGGLSYTILGQVRDPGKKDIMGTTYLLDAIAAANGFAVGFFRSQTQDLADLHHAFVARQGEYIPVDFWRLVTQGDLSQNIEIKDGDYIFVPSSLIRNIYVIGEVRLPANIGYLNRETLAGALAKARGITRNAGRYCYVVRGSLSNPRATRVNLEDLHHGRIRDILLQPNDIVYVPRRNTMFVEDVIYTALRSFTSGFFNVMGRESFVELEPDAADSDFGGSVFFP